MSLENWCRVDIGDAKKFFTHLQREGLAFSTIAGYHSALAGVYSFLPYKGIITTQVNIFKNPLLAFPKGSCVPQKPTKALASEDVVKLLAIPDRSTMIGKRDYALLCLLFGAGLRRSEILKLESSHCAIGAGGLLVVKLYNTKARAYDEQPLPEWADEGIMRYLVDRAIDMKRPTILFPMSHTTLHKIFKGLVEKAGLDCNLFSLHSCRCTAINLLIDEDVPLHRVRDFARHGSITTTERYEQRLNKTENNPGKGLFYHTKITT